MYNYKNNLRFPISPTLKIISFVMQKSAKAQQISTEVIQDNQIASTALEKIPRIYMKTPSVMCRIISLKRKRNI